MSILVTGGAGYIGSHTCVELLNAGFEVIVADNLVNSSEEALRRVEKITGKKVKFYNADLCDAAVARAIFAENPGIGSVIHFAALKAVGESVQKPLEYYTNNLTSTLVVLNAMREFGVKNFVFSSSATVYGDPASVPVREDFPTSTTNPYGTTKLFIERILTDCCKADATLNVALLRYFNPIGAHPSGLIGEDPNGIPNNLVPYIAQVAVGKLDHVNVFGNDYNTPDGTGVRDYIHVVDLARGHVAALQKLQQKPGLFICNLGTGKGYSVLEVIGAFSKACGKPLKYEIGPRRPGDIAEVYADPAKAKNELGWQAWYGIEEMCADSWRWQSGNPNGYAG
ncbi:MAG: UDP-glucose 4-epimerase GalE [Oscillospiraceae bacterium]